MNNGTDRKRIVVHDRMQDGYAYELTEPEDVSVHRLVLWSRMG